MFAGTGTFGGHGGVVGDWATYLTMAGAASRGWIFKHESTNVASISSQGHLSLSTINEGIGVHVQGERTGEDKAIVRG